jgi:hypothetical protein
MLLSFDSLFATGVLLDCCHVYGVKETDAVGHLMVGLQIVLVDLFMVKN